MISETENHDVEAVKETESFIVGIWRGLQRESEKRGAKQGGRGTSCVRRRVHGDSGSSMPTRGQLQKQNIRAILTDRWQAGVIQKCGASSRWSPYPENRRRNS